MGYVFTKDPDDLRLIWQLNYSEYLKHGYCLPSSEKIFKYNPHLDTIPETHIAVVKSGADLLGTVSITEDGPQKLATDPLFPIETDTIRRLAKHMGMKVCSPWRIITKDSYRDLGVVIQLFSAVAEIVSGKNIDIMLFAINPRHIGFYTRMLGAEKVAVKENDQTVNDAPAMLIISSRQTASLRWNAIKERFIGG
jgi:hypothetical protein